MSIPEILFDGSYLYFDKEINYSQENFKFVHIPDVQNYHVYSEILSRTETGEFLKILVRYEMNSHFIPYLVRIEKSMGKLYAEEVFKIDPNEHELHYTFKNSHSSQEFKRPHNAKHYLTTPSFATTALFTLSKKFDPTGRTPVVFVASQNEWEYLGPPTEKIVYVDLLARELTDFKLNNKELSASHFGLFENDANQHSNEEPVNLYVSKHYAIPYQLLNGEQKIMIKTLKKH